MGQREEQPTRSSPNEVRAFDFQLLFESAPGLNLVLLPDAPKYTIVAATDAYLAASMTTREQLVGHGIFEMFPDNPDDHEAKGTLNLRASLDRVLLEKRLDTMAVQKYDIPSPDGGFAERYWSPLNKPIFDRDGNLAFIMHRVEDVTEYIHLRQTEDATTRLAEELQTKAEEMEGEIYSRAQELQAANERLRIANEKLGLLDTLKNEFFSNVSHEFRTPLTLLLGPIEDLLSQHASLTPDQREQLALAHRNALRLMRLVNTLLDFSRLEAGKMKARFVPTNLAQFTVELASIFRSAISKAGLRLKIDCPPLPEDVFVDREMYEKIVLNLIANSLKHTLDGEISVSIRAKDTRAILTVKDTGSGIPPEELDHVFERFHRVQGSAARNHDGTGIGLSLVRELCHLHKGEVFATSTLGEGTQMVVAIPFGHAHLPAEQIAHEEPDLTPSTEAAYIHDARQWLETRETARSYDTVGETDHARILLVDDSEDMRTYIIRLLHQSRQGWTITTAQDGQEALDACRVAKPNLILSDIMMPRMDGLQLVAALRADPDLQRVPIILLSARAGEESTIEGLEHGADDYLVKPFSGPELITRVRAHLSLSQTRENLLEELNAKNRMLDTVNAELEAFSYSVAHDLRAPVRSINGFAGILREEFSGQLGDEGLSYLDRIRAATERMGMLIEDLLKLSKINRLDLTLEEVDLSQIAQEIATGLEESSPERHVRFEIQEGLKVIGDGSLLRIALENLLGNAWKFTRKNEAPIIRVGQISENSESVFFVEDNGDGFDMNHAANLFRPFHRLHNHAEFEGTGIGLATVQRIINRHGGEVSAEGRKGIGATFTFSIRKPQ